MSRYDMDPGLTDADLDAIEQRAEAVWANRHDFDSHEYKAAVAASASDVPALVAEVHRLLVMEQRVQEYDPETRSRAFHRCLAAHDREVRVRALREAADKIHVSLQQAHKRDGRPLDPMFSQHDQGLWDGYKNAENWLRARAEHIGRGK